MRHLVFYSALGGTMGLSRHRLVVPWSEINSVTKANTMKVTLLFSSRVADQTSITSLG